MTKKDYELIATPFKSSHKYIGLHENTIHELAKMMASVLEKENSKFNAEKFLSACGIKD